MLIFANKTTTKNNIAWNPLITDVFELIDIIY